MRITFSKFFFYIDSRILIIFTGQNKRKTAHTLLNTESSRSHSVFTIRLVQAPLGPNGDQIMKVS